jgi:iron(III) transport system ATP-binding protein
MTIALRLTGLLVGTENTGIEARVIGRRFLGSVDLLVVAVQGIERPLRARLRAGQLPMGVRDVFVSVDLQDVIVFEGSQGTA